MSWSRFITNFLSIVGGAAAGTVGIAAWSTKHHDLRLILITIVALSSLISLILSTLAFFADRPKNYPTPEKINAFMWRWVQSEGKVAIFSRDLTWHDGVVHMGIVRGALARLPRSVSEPPSIREALLEKARRGELTLCIEQETDFAKELKDAGATICEYGHLRFVPLSRFTIVRHGRADAEVAIGRTVNGVHQIERYKLGEHPACAIAIDLVEAIR